MSKSNFEIASSQIKSQYRLKHGLLKQKIVIYVRHLPDGTFTVMRNVLESENNGKNFNVVEKQEFSYKSKSHATRKLNELKANSPSCEFFIEKMLQEGGISYELLDKGEVFNESQTLWFCVGITDANVAGNGNAKADVASNVSEATLPSNTGGLNEKDEAGTEIDVLNPPHWLFGDIEADLAKLQISEQYATKVMEHGQLKTIMLRRGLNSPAFIDTISFVIQESAFRDLNDDL